ncbi:DUF916 and DUF3324 domain-containing protein [uncultured Vagococcus sp.]|uniref:DUF916 and DUF3324 domain-containing protein n=1 Tax=uncultured Vagococcus sp. TaxID=189676 RepID=UPI0028D57AB1|nr:DUF916 and DUF3324 domain-containing protein [uncultured Vagococcus sp.]
MQQYVKKIVIITATILCLVLAVSGQTRVWAETFPFEVQTIIPDNQVDKSKTYFDLKMEKGQKQTVEVLIRNVTKKDITVEVAFSRLTTNSNGVLEYKKVKGKPDESLVIDIEELAQVVDDEIAVKANSDVKAKITIEAPKNDFSGILAGGLTFKLKTTDAKKNSDKNDDKMAIKNQYSYDIALVLHGNVPVEELPSELVLSTVGVINTSGRNLIFANLQNPQPKNLKDVTIDSKVIEKESSKVVLENKRVDLEVAPNSNFDYGIPLNGTILDAGNYTLKLAIAIGSETLELEKEFTISGIEAEKIIAEAKPVVQKSNTVLYVLIGLLIIIAMAVPVLLKYNRTQGTSSKMVRKKAIKRRKTSGNRR